ncbi:ER lumen protein-retaining receptor 2 [Orchesella cincta]|uniref:ER lumen protein-retaining receptor 2 n=1 Tax=Orchesella cincta TaxID=48709 RepID=A0A1D2MH12_ORCCI|nr:ER lumen protein-retaining receptor 2 [Orchesella cincta]
MNAFRLAGDLHHLAAIIILLFRIYRSESCAGFSGKSQVLFALVFSARYADLMTNFVSIYNSIMKVVFLTTSYLTLYLIYCRFKKTYEANSDSFRFEFLILIAGSLALLYNHEFASMEILWTFSIYLEAIAIIPQLYMFYNTKDVSMFPGHYVFAMGSYRGKIQKFLFCGNTLTS